MEKESVKGNEKRQILVFQVAEEELGLDISCIREVLRPQKIFPLPKTPPFIEGVFKLRGHIVALIDLRKKLQLKSAGVPDKHVIVCKVNRLIVGLTVDRFKEIIPCSDENFRPTPEVVSIQMGKEILTGIATVGERIIPILNLEYILTQKEMNELATMES